MSTKIKSISAVSARILLGLIYFVLVSISSCIFFLPLHQAEEWRMLLPVDYFNPDISFRC